MKTFTYSLDTRNDLVIALMDDKRILIDTGSPGSFSNGSPIKFLEKEVTPDGGAMLGMVSIDSVNEFLEHPVDALFGGDLLGDHPFKIDFNGKTITFFTEGYSDEGGTTIPLQVTMGGVVFPMGLNGREVSAVLDTGAHYSYVTENEPETKNFTREIEDFNPMTGRFTSKMGEVSVTVAGRDLVFDFGTLSGMLGMLLSMIGASTVVGAVLLKQFDVLVDYKGGKLVLWKNK